jgi:hypothetical protein
MLFRSALTYEFADSIFILSFPDRLFDFDTRLRICYVCSAYDVPFLSFPINVELSIISALMKYGY